MSRGEMMSVAAKVELQLKIKDVIAYLSAYWMQKYSSMATPCRADLRPRPFSKTSILIAGGRDNWPMRRGGWQ